MGHLTDFELIIMGRKGQSARSGLTLSMGRGLSPLPVMGARAVPLPPLPVVPALVLSMTAILAVLLTAGMDGMFISNLFVTCRKPRLQF